MIWKKIGLIFKPVGKKGWIKTHAGAPTIKHLSGDLFRIFFYSRDKDNVSRIGYLDIDLKEPKKVISLSESPVFDVGKPGAYDQSGVMPSCIINSDKSDFLYYTGWTKGVAVPFYFFVGLAISEDGKTFRRFSKAPLLERIDVDPFLTASPSILRENGLWRMWYVSGVKWAVESGSLKHYYHIKYAESKDGINWERKGVVCIDFKSKEEYAIARPCVIKEDSIYKMWYSYRGKSYRIGYAESKDGIFWERKDDEAGIDVSETGWDSEMIEYAFVFKHKNKKCMLYNGNGYGKTGLGYAILAENK